MDQRQVVKVEVEYEDGEVRGAVGEDADVIWTTFLKALEFYLRMQKRSYEGPALSVVRAARRVDLGETDGDVRVRRTLSELAREGVRLGASDDHEEQGFDRPGRDSGHHGGDRRDGPVDQL